MTKDELLSEQESIKALIKTHELLIEESRTAIYWQKKRLKVVESQLKSLPEEKEKV